MKYLLVRSLLWHVWTVLALLPLAVLLLLASPVASWRFLYRIAQWWAKWSIFGLKWICGVDWLITGITNLPQDGTKTILLCKHQSAWETLALVALLPTPLCFVYKRELHWIPFFGWAIARSKMIYIDRSQRAQAFKKVVEQGQMVMDQSRWVIMFPEGTRTARGRTVDYKTGGTRLACATGAQVVPIAVNSAKCWPRNSFLKSPGVIELKIGTPINSERYTPDDLMIEVKTWIEGQMRLIDATAYSHDANA